MDRKRRIVCLKALYFYPGTVTRHLRSTVLDPDLFSIESSDQERQGHGNKATTRFEESIWVDIEKMVLEAVNKWDRKPHRIGPQSDPCAPPDAENDDEDQTYGENSDVTTEQSDNELNTSVV
jgi:hypothetical protein